MAHFQDLIESKYLKKADLGAQEKALFTFSRLEKQNVAGKDQAPEYKQIAFFAENAKGMVLNKTNLGLLAIATGENDTDNWVGKKVVVYYDPTVTHMGKIVGGLRIRKPYGADAPPPQAPPAADRNSDIQF